MQSLRLLLVEDNPGDMVLTREVLARAELPTELSVVNNGEAAIEFLTRTGSYESAERPDLVLLDLNLPKLSGHEVLAFIRRDPELHGLPVVILSSSTAPEDVQAAYANHVNCYCQKPKSFADYGRLVENIQQFWRSVELLRT